MDHSRFSMSTTQSSQNSQNTLASITTSIASITAPPPAGPSTHLNSPTSPRPRLLTLDKPARHAAFIATLVAAGWSRADADHALSEFKDDVGAAEGFLREVERRRMEERKRDAIDVDDPGRPREAGGRREGQGQGERTSRWRSTVFGAKTLYDFYTARYLVRAGWSADVVGRGNRESAVGDAGGYHYHRWSSLNGDDRSARDSFA